MYRPSSPASHSAEHLLPFTSDRSSEENSTQPVTTANDHDEVTASFSFSYWRRSDHTTSTRLRFPTLTSRRIVPFFLLVSCGFILPLLINMEFLPTTFTIRDLYPKGARPQTPFPSDPRISGIRDGALPVEASLETRLELLKRVPLVERDHWIALNEQTCSQVPSNRNEVFHKDSLPFWESLNSTTLHTIRKSMIEFLSEELSSPRGRLGLNAFGGGKPRERAHGKGRGLVFAAGNSDTFDRVLTSLRMMRKYTGTDAGDFSAEIFSYEGESEVLSDEKKQELCDLGATLRTIRGDSVVKDAPRGKKNYQIKATAILESSFREVLYLDSDNIPVAPLLEVFDSPGYKRLGAMFWPDYWKTSPENPIWQIIGVQCRDEWEQEAGQILLDKEKHLDALLLAEWMLKDHELFFKLSDGDKDVFRFAFLFLRKRWSVPGRYVSVGMLPGDTQTGRCGHTMLQSDHRGRPFAVHQNLLKIFWTPLPRGYIWGRQVSMKLDSDDRALEPVDPSDSSRADDVDVDDVDCDMLANADLEGRAIGPAPASVRRRAALERGLRPRFHGGWGPPLCIDITWQDPRPEETRNRQPTNISTSVVDEDVMEESDVHRPGVGLGLEWRDPLVEIGWDEDPRLGGFEERYFENGGRPNGWSIDARRRMQLRRRGY